MNLTREELATARATAKAMTLLNRPQIGRAGDVEVICIQVTSGCFKSVALEIDLPLSDELNLLDGIANNPDCFWAVD